MARRQSTWIWFSSDSLDSRWIHLKSADASQHDVGSESGHVRGNGDREGGRLGPTMCASRSCVSFNTRDGILAPTAASPTDPDVSMEVADQQPAVRRF